MAILTVLWIGLQCVIVVLPSYSLVVLYLVLFSVKSYCNSRYSYTDNSSCYIWESPPQFENRLMARVYVTGVWKISYVTCGFSSIKIDYSDNPKSLISRIN